MIGTPPCAAPCHVAGTHVSLGAPGHVHVLAVGADLKNSVCSTYDRDAWISDPHGDLVDPANYLQFVETVKHLIEARDEPARVAAHDLHPLYFSTRYAEQLGPPYLPIQHHHAHAISCAADAGLELPVVAVVCDGTGYGTDGRSWGGEVLVCDAVSFRRVAHLDYFPLPGGDAAAKWTWRPGLALLRDSLPGSWRHSHLPALERIDPAELAVVSRQLDVALNTPQSSSLGRLFDAAAFFTGICMCNETEGQAAVAVEVAAERATQDATTKSPYRFQLVDNGAGSTTIDWRPMIREMVEDVVDGRDCDSVCARFHATVIQMFSETAVVAARSTGIDRVVLSGGCMNNRLLRAGLEHELTRFGSTVGVHSHVPCGDAGIALGQAVVASAIVQSGASNDGG